MRRESTAERAAWTAFVEGTPVPRENKYGAQRVDGYASRWEARAAQSLHALNNAGKIRDLKEQVRIELVPGNGGKLKPIIYIADFTYYDLDGGYHVLDAKGFKTPVYRLKKRLAALLLGIQIEEV